MQHKNQSELEFPYRFPLQDPCCDSGHPEASIMSTEFASIFAEQVQKETVTVCTFWKKGIEYFSISQLQQDIQILQFILKSPLYKEMLQSSFIIFFTSP